MRGRHGDKDDGRRRLESSFLGPQNLYVSWAAANRLRQAGILTDELSEKLGISRKWLDIENAKDLAEIKTVSLLTSNLKGKQVETFSREVRTAPNAMSAHEAAGYKAERQSRLESLSVQFEAAGDTPPDGWAAYRFITNMERMPGGDPERAKLKAAEFAEYYRHLAIARGRGETADSVFLSKYPRLRP